MLAVIAAENSKRGDCRLSNKEIADVAGVCITTVKNALRAARGLNLLTVEERRLTAFRNASNVVRIVNPEWRAWLRLGGQIRTTLTYPVKNTSVGTADPDLGCRRAEASKGAATTTAEVHRGEGG